MQGKRQPSPWPLGAMLPGAQAGGWAGGRRARGTGGRRPRSGAGPSPLARPPARHRSPLGRGQQAASLSRAGQGQGRGRGWGAPPRLPGCYLALAPACKPCERLDDGCSGAGAGAGASKGGAGRGGRGAPRKQTQTRPNEGRGAGARGSSKRRQQAAQACPPRYARWRVLACIIRGSHPPSHVSSRPTPSRARPRPARPRPPGRSKRPAAGLPSRPSAP